MPALTYAFVSGCWGSLTTGERLLHLLKWGLIPYWCHDPKGGRRPTRSSRCRPISWWLKSTTVCLRSLTLLATSAR